MRAIVHRTCRPCWRPCWQRSQPMVLCALNAGPRARYWNMAVEDLIFPDIP